MRLVLLDQILFFLLLPHLVVAVAAVLIWLAIMAGLVAGVAVIKTALLVELESQAKEMQVVLAHLDKAVAAVELVLLVEAHITTQMLLVEQDCVQPLLVSECFTLVEALAVVT
jgi:hypothetical protein